MRRRQSSESAAVTEIDVPPERSSPRLTDWVADEEIQWHGWPARSSGDVRTHPLVRVAARRFRDAAREWRDEHHALGEYPSIRWWRAVAVGNVVPWP